MSIINEQYISFDVEASGPIPATYSMLSLGACVVGSSDTLEVSFKNSRKHHALSDAIYQEKQFEFFLDLVKREKPYF